MIVLIKYVLMVFSILPNFIVIKEIDLVENFFTDRNQFDNPVYSYQGNSRNDDGTDTLLNNLNIRNFLTRKHTNSERTMLGCKKNCFTDDEEDNCRGILPHLFIF